MVGKGGIGRGEGKMLKVQHNGLKLFTRRNTEKGALAFSEGKEKEVTLQRNDTKRTERGRR